jgi:uncharacterized membrane protein YczE
MSRGPVAFVRSRDDRERLARCVTGLVLCGVGFSSLVDAHLGNDPWDVFHQGVKVHTGVPIGTVSILTGAVVLLAWIPFRQRPGIGTILNMFLIGAVQDVLIPRFPTPHELVARWAMLLAGTLVAGTGVGLYIGSGLGPGPRDGLMTAIAARWGTIRLVRTLIELSALLVGWLLGGPVGVGTLVFAVIVGPIVHASLDRFRMPPRVRPEVPINPSGGTPSTDPVG